MRSGGLLFTGLCASAAVLASVAGGASACCPFHGIAFAKNCSETTSVGDPYACGYEILNVVDGAHDSLKITGLSDEVHSAGGPVASGNILGALQLVFEQGSISCVGGTGSGTAADPYIGATACTLPFGSIIDASPYSFYVVRPADAVLPNRQLTDTATLDWADLCDGQTDPICTKEFKTTAAGGFTLVGPALLASSTVTDIHNAAAQVVTTVEAGTTVHDFVTVTGPPGAPVPTGTVSVLFYANDSCVGFLSKSDAVPLDAAGHADAAAFSFTPSVGRVAFKASYSGDLTYRDSVGPCEPLAVVDANVQLTPASAQNSVAGTHTLTGHVNVNTGSGGYVNAPHGTVISFSIAGPGTFVGPSSCTTAGATGSCQVTITTGVPGTTTVHAATIVTVEGLAVSRATGDAHTGDSADAATTWQGIGGMIATKGAKCRDYAGGTAIALDQVTYSVQRRGNVVRGVTPDAFVFYSKLTTFAPNQLVTVDQANTSTNDAAPFQIPRGDARLWNGDCASFSVGTLTAGATGASFLIRVPGTYIVGIKYSTKPVVKTPVPVPADPTYEFTTSLGGGSGASVLLTPRSS